MPIALVFTAPQVPAGIVPNATSISRVGQLAVEPAADLVELDAETLGDQVDRRLPGRRDVPGTAEQRLEVEGAPEAHSVHHHRRHRVVVVQRDLRHPERADAADCVDSTSAS